METLLQINSSNGEASVSSCIVFPLKMEFLPYSRWIQRVHVVFLCEWRRMLVKKTKTKKIPILPF